MRRGKHPKALALAALGLSALLLAGCAPSVISGMRIPAAGPGQGSAEVVPTPDFTLPSQGGVPRTDAQQTYGSAGLLAWPTTLVSVYLDEKDGAAWTQEMIGQSQENLAQAVGWIGAQAGTYGVTPRIHCDDGAGDPSTLLFVHSTYDGTFPDGQDDEDSAVLDEAFTALCESLDTEALHQKYATSSVGFLLFLPVPGSSYSMVHYMDNGSAYYYEYSCLYAYDLYSGPTVPEGPATYAHEILHLYGAPDLYEGSTDQFATPELLDYVAQTWPDAIMRDTYTPDGAIQYGGIDQTLCPLTAYRLGLCDSFEGMEVWSDVAALPPAAFGSEDGGHIGLTPPQTAA